MAESIDTSCENLQQLIQNLALEGKRFAVEKTNRLIVKSKLEQTTIAPEDRIEIIQAVGGG